MLPEKCSPKNAPQNKMLPIKMLSIKMLPEKKMLPFKMLPEKKFSPGLLSSTDLKLI